MKLKLLYISGLLLLYGNLFSQGNICQKDIIINAPIVSSTDYNANNSIIASSIISDNLNVNFKGKSIVITNGFYVKGTSSTVGFKAIIDPCTMSSADYDPKYLGAPNSYIFDVNNTQYGGLYIPVGKAYAMWGDSNGYMKKPIPAGTLSASVYWEDVEGLIESAVIKNNLGKDSKIEVKVNKSRGSGNAVIAFKVNGKIYWSWHIWITDDPTHGLSYENNHPALATGITGSRVKINSNNEPDPSGISVKAFIPKFMDRNLGATSNSFLGNNWHKSGGLMYQWGRKDPFPALMYKDNSQYIVKGEVGNIGSPNFSSRLVSRPYDNIRDNIEYSVQNPYKYINSEDNTAWYSKGMFNNDKNFDLWSDNSGGGDGGLAVPTTDVSGTVYQAKSSYDPCPQGWRVPSYQAKTSTITAFTPWGNSYTLSSGIQPGAEDLSMNSRYPSVKIYPGLGFDFQDGIEKYYIGKYPLTGKYTRYENGGVVYQDINSESIIWGATTNGSAEGRNFYLIADPIQNNNQGQYIVSPFSAYSPSGGAAVRCMQDPYENLLVSNFPTEYIKSVVKDYTGGLDTPNSYIVTKSGIAKTIDIPINKAYSVYNQYLTNHQWLPDGKLSANIYWTTDTGLLSKVAIDNPALKENAKIRVTVNPNKHGNALVSFHLGPNGNSTDPVYWSWHIWVPNQDPTTNTITYTNQSVLNRGRSHIINETETGLPPLTTTLMDRNLGAIEATVSNTKGELTYGLQYQWGRKDPIPTFKTADMPYDVFLGSSTAQGTNYAKVSFDDYQSGKYAKAYKDYSNLIVSTDKLYEKTGKILKYSAQNPFIFMYNNVSASNQKDWLSDEIGVFPERWGHGGEKSPFDPCPAGWRVPDNLMALYRYAPSKAWDFTGSSYLYKEGVRQDIFQNVSAYGIERKTYGYKAVSGSTYLIRNLPNNGVRGLSGGYSLENTNWSSGLWTAVLVSSGIASYFNGDEFMPSNDMNPVIAVDVRCAKDESRYMGAKPASNTPLRKEAFTEVKNETIQEASSEFILYPNPVTEVLHIDAPSKIQLVTVLDYSGKQVKVFNLNGANEINLQGLASGIYMIKIQTEKQTVVKKIIKN